MMASPNNCEYNAAVRAGSRTISAMWSMAFGISGLRDKNRRGERPIFAPNLCAIDDLVSGAPSRDHGPWVTLNCSDGFFLPQTPATQTDGTAGDAPVPRHGQIYGQEAGAPGRQLHPRH